MAGRPPSDERARAGVEIEKMLRGLAAERKLGEISDTNIAAMRDRVLGEMSPALMRIFSSQAYAGIITGIVQAAFEVSYPSKRNENIHASPTAEKAVPGDAAHFDALGNTRLDKLASGGTRSFAAKDYGALASDKWDPGTGIMGLNERNFASSPFSAAGLDLATTQWLARLGFDKGNILNAARDARALGFDPARDREAMHDHAYIDRHDRNAREFNSKLQDYQRRLNESEKYQEILREMQATNDAARLRELEMEKRRMQLELQRETGLREHIDRVQDPELRDREEHRVDAVGRLTEQKAAVLEMGKEDARDLGAEQKAKMDAAHAGERVEAKTSISAKADAKSAETAGQDLLADFGLSGPAMETTSPATAPQQAGAPLASADSRPATRTGATPSLG